MKKLMIATVLGTLAFATAAHAQDNGQQINNDSNQIQQDQQNENQQRRDINHDNNVINQQRQDIHHDNNVINEDQGAINTDKQQIQQDRSIERQDWKSGNKAGAEAEQRHPSGSFANRQGRSA
jgi:uncharacterized protein HemX